MSLARMARWLGGFGAASAAILVWSPGAYGQGLLSKCDKCPPPFIHYSEGPPHLKFKKACPKPVCDPCTLPHYGYFATCWRPWLLPPDWSHCPVPPPGALVPQPPPPPYPPPPGRPLEPTPAPPPNGQTLPAPRPTTGEPQARRPAPASATLSVRPAVQDSQMGRVVVPPGAVNRGQPVFPSRTYQEPPLGRP